MEFKENVQFLIHYSKVSHGEQFAFRKKILMYTIEMTFPENQLRTDLFYSRMNILTLIIALMYESWY